MSLKIPHIWDRLFGASVISCSMRRAATGDVTEMLAEFNGDSLGDARLDERLRRIVSLAAMDPGESFPEQMASLADREALYRFLANRKVTPVGRADWARGADPRSDPRASGHSDRA